jgi:hypothetical protein
VTEDVGTFIKNEIAGQAAPVTVSLARTPLVPAPSLAAPGTGGNYPVADGINVVIIPPTWRPGSVSNPVRSRKPVLS